MIAVFLKDTVCKRCFFLYISRKIWINPKNEPMKKVLILLLVSSIFLGGCEFIRTKILGKPSKAEIEAMEQARQDSIRQDSIEQAHAARIQDSIAQAKADSIAKADSLAEAKRKEEAERAKNKYHVISGSFKTPKYAERYKERMIEVYGYDGTLCCF